MLLVKRIQIGKVKLSLFADDMILYTEDPKDVIRKLPSELRALEWLLSGQLHTFLLYFPIVHSLCGLRTTEFIELDVLVWFHRERSMDVCVVYDDSTSSKCSTMNNVSFSCVCATLLQVFATLLIVVCQALLSMGF